MKWNSYANRPNDLELRDEPTRPFYDNLITATLKMWVRLFISPVSYSSSSLFLFYNHAKLKAKAPKTLLKPLCIYF